MGTYKTGILGVSDSGSSPPLQTLRKYDRSDRIYMRALGRAPLLHLMTTKHQKRPVGDIKYYVTEDDYYIQGGTLKGCTVAGADTALTTSLGYVYVAGPASEAANTFLRVGDKLHVPAFQTNQTNTKGTGDGSTDGTVMVAGETMIVEEIVTANVVRVTRGGGAGTLTGNVTAGSGNTLNFDLMGAAFADASASPDGLADSLDEDYNYREIFRIAWDVSGRNLMQDMYGTPDVQRLAVKSRTQLFRYIERRCLFGHRHLGYNSLGHEISHSGGLFEYIADTSIDGTRVAAYDASKDLVTGDGTQRIWKLNKNFTLDNINHFMERAYKYGENKDRKALVAGRKFLVMLENLLRPYYGSFDWDVNTFGFNIALAKSSWGVLPIVIEEEFSEGSSGYDYCAVAVDFDYLWYTYGEGPCAIKGCGNKNSDVHLHQEIQANDEAHRKDELFADIGWDQKFRKAHSLIIAESTDF